jgi:hypothetical protein
MNFLVPLLTAAALALATVLPIEDTGPVIHTFGSNITDGGARTASAPNTRLI